MIAVVVQVGVLIALLSQSGARITTLHGVFAVVTLGLLLIAFNQPIGRSIFVPAALVQIAILGLGTVLGFVGLVAAWLQQSGPATMQAAGLTIACVFDTLVLCFGLTMTFVDFKRVSPVMQ